MIYIKNYNTYIELGQNFEVLYYRFDQQSSCFDQISRHDIIGSPNEILFLSFVPSKSDKRPDRTNLLSTLSYQPYNMVITNHIECYHFIIDAKNRLHSTIEDEITIKLFNGEDMEDQCFWRDLNINERFHVFGNITLYKGHHYYPDNSSTEYYTCDLDSFSKHRIFAHYYDENGCFCHNYYLYHNESYMVACNHDGIRVIYYHDKTSMQFYGKFIFLKKISDENTIILLLDLDKYYWLSIDKFGNSKTHNTEISSSYKFHKGESYCDTFYLFTFDREFLLWNSKHSNIESSGILEGEMCINELSIKEYEEDVFFYCSLHEQSVSGYYILNKYGNIIYKYLRNGDGYIVVMYPPKQLNATKELYGYADNYGEFVLYPVFDNVKIPIFCKNYLLTEQKTSKKSCIYSVYDLAGDLIYQDFYNLPLHVSKSKNIQIKEYVFHDQVVKCLVTNGVHTKLENNFTIITLVGGNTIVMYGKNKILQELEDAKLIPCVNFPSVPNSMSIVDPSKMLLFKKDGKWGVANNEGFILLPNKYDNICFAFYKIIADGHVFKYDKHLQIWEDITPLNAVLIAIGDFHFAYNINNTYYIQRSLKTGLINSSDFGFVNKDGNQYYSLSFNSAEKRFESYKHYIHDDYDYENIYDRNNYNDNIDMDQQSIDFWN